MKELRAGNQYGTRHNGARCTTERMLVRSESMDIVIEGKRIPRNNSHQGAICPEGMKWRNLPGACRTSTTTAAWEPSDELIAWSRPHERRFHRALNSARLTLELENCVLRPASMTSSLILKLPIPQHSE